MIIVIYFNLIVLTMHASACACACMCACMCVRMCACMCACMHPNKRSCILTNTFKGSDNMNNSSSKCVDAVTQCSAQHSTAQHQHSTTQPNTAQQSTARRSICQHDAPVPSGPTHGYTSVVAGVLFASTHCGLCIRKGPAGFLLVAEAYVTGVGGVCVIRKGILVQLLA